jgi:ABC-type nitrate/sulfonate/bicarbonate transport system permease component
MVALSDVLDALTTQAAGRTAAAVGICSQVNTHVFVDASGQTLRPAIIWQDQRCGATATELNARLAETAPEKAARFIHTLVWGFARTFSVVALAIAWEVLARSGTFTPFQLPALSAVLERIWSDAVSGDLWINTALTLYRALTAFAICAVGGVLIGMAMSRNVFAHWFFDPIVSVGFPMPKIAFLPIIILWLGVYDLSKISMVVFDAIFPVVTATLIGIQGVEKELIWSARGMGANDRETMWQVILPAAMSRILTAIQVALPIALIVEIVCEMTMGGYGLGGTMLTASRFADSRGVFAALLEIAIVGYVLVKGMSLLRRRLLIWHPEANDPATA